MLQTISAFPWSLAVTIMAVAAMLIFRSSIGDFISRSHEVKAGRFRFKATPAVERKAIEEIVRGLEEVAATADGELDTRRLVIRDAQDHVRIVAATVESGEPFLALFDEDGEVRLSLSASSAKDPCGVAMLMFPRKGHAPAEMASFIGAEQDGSGAVGVRDIEGNWKEMS